MSGAWAIVEGEPWRIHRCGQDATPIALSEAGDLPPGELASRIAAALDAAGYAGEDVLLGLDSRSCLVGPVDLASLPRRPEHSLMVYALEPSLPVPAEQIVADFVVRDGAALGVATVAESFRTILIELETRGVRTRSLVPWALLAVHHRGKERTASNREIEVWEREGRLETFTFESGRLADWWSLTADARALRRHLRMTAPSDGPNTRVVMSGCRDDVVRLVEEEGFEVEVHPDAHLDAAAEQGTVEVLAGSVAPVVELRRDALAATEPYRAVRGLLAATVVSVVAALACTVAAFWLRGARYDAVAEAYHRRQAEVFRQILPDEPVPVGIQARLEGELSKASGIRSGAARLPDTGAVLEILDRMVGTLPADLRYELAEVVVDGRRATLQGDVRSHGDAARLADALREAGFEAEAPRTDQVDPGRVSFQLTVSWPETAQPATEPGS